MLPDRVSNPGPLTYELGALPIALRGPAILLVKIALIANRVFFKTLFRSINTSFIIKDCGQGVLKR